jgi:hypothetical protein
VSAGRPPEGRRLLAGSVSALLLTATAVATAGTVPAAAATNPASTANTATVTVDRLTPGAPQPGQQLEVTGTVTNRGTESLTDVNVQLRLSTTPVGSRSELASLSGGSGRPPGDPVAVVALPQSLDPGASTPFDLRVQVDQLGLGGPGVYPLAVEVIAADSSSGTRIRFGAARTFIPWDLSRLRPTRLAVLWPVSAGPTRNADGVPVGTELADQVSGRLTDLLNAAAGTDVSWLVDGETLEGVSVLAAGAPTAAGTTATTGTTPTSPPDPTAAGWLTQLRTQTAGTTVMALPYADPDVVAVVRAGLSDDLGTATVLGTEVTADVLRRTASATVQPIAWPAEGTADRASLTAVGSTGTTQILLSDTYAPAVESTSYTPSGIGPLSGTGLTAVVADSALSRLLATPPAQLGGPVLGEQRMLAELAMVGLELPSAQRSLVVVPPRGWSPDPTYIHALLRSVDAAPWAQVTGLADLTAVAARGPSRQRPAYPSGVRKRELDAVQMGLVRDGHQRLAALTAVLTSAQSVTDTYTRALLRAQSAAWRADRSAGRAYAAHVVGQINALQANVHLVQPGPVTLAARSGRIPVTVVNDLDQQVTVRVGMTAVPSVRLTLVQPGPVVLEPHSSTTLDVAADAPANGSVQVVARLLTPDGAPLGPPEAFAVQVTGFGAVAELLVGGALVLLSVALVVRIARAVRTGRRPGSPASVREPAR